MSGTGDPEPGPELDCRKTADGRNEQRVFMHCLPVRRNMIVTDEVIDSPAAS